MRLRYLLPYLALVVVGCGHEQPFETRGFSSDQPFRPGVPARLTFNPGTDLHPAWTPDGASLLYAWQQSGQPVIDRCIGEMAATGGTLTGAICNPNPPSADSADLFDLPAVSPGGRLLYVRATSLPGRLAPHAAGIFLATLADPLAATQLLTLPYVVPGGSAHGGISHSAWVNDSRLIYVGLEVTYKPASQVTGPADTLIAGLEIVDLTLGGSQPTITIVPGTYGATSAALSDGKDTLYYTLEQDSIVYRRVLATGQVSVAHDFGARGVARDVTVLGNRLVAVVGGVVQPPGGPDVPDAGPLVSVDLDTGAEFILPTETSLLFRRPAFSPAGGTVRLVAEGYPATFGPPPAFDTTVTKLADLYLYTAP